MFFRKKKTEEEEKEPQEPVQEAQEEEWDGCGDGMFVGVKRWYYTRFKDYEIVREYSTRWDALHPQTDDWDEPFDCDMVVRLRKKKNVPEEAVHCTGEPHTSSIDRARIRYEQHDNGFRATDAWLYLEFNGFDDCLTKKWTSMDHVSMTKVLVIAGIVVALLVGFLIVRLT